MLYLASAWVKGTGRFRIQLDQHKGGKYTGGKSSNHTDLTPEWTKYQVYYGTPGGEVDQVRVRLMLDGKGAVAFLDTEDNTECPHAGTRFSHGDGFDYQYAPDMLEVGRQFGGQDALKYLYDKAAERDMIVQAWSSTAHLWCHSPLFAVHPDWIMLNASGQPHNGGYHDLLATRFATGWADYALGRYRVIREQTGLGSLWLDSQGGEAATESCSCSCSYSCSEPCGSVSRSTSRSRRQDLPTCADAAACHTYRLSLAR